MVAFRDGAAPPPSGLIEPASLGRVPTYADVEVLPEHLRGEIVGGQLYVLPRPKPRHSRVIFRPAGWLDGPFDQGQEGLGGWLFLLEPELHLGALDRPIAPDLAGWRRERMSDAPEEAAVALRPDWVCEVLSESTEIYDRSVKRPVFARHGVPHAWLIDPEAKTLEVYVNDAGIFRPAASWRNEIKVRAAPFDALDLDLGRLWG